MRVALKSKGTRDYTDGPNEESKGPVDLLELKNEFRVPDRVSLDVGSGHSTK